MIIDSQIYFVSAFHDLVLMHVLGEAFEMFESLLFHVLINWMENRTFSISNIKIIRFLGFTACACHYVRNATISFDLYFLAIMDFSSGACSISDYKVGIVINDHKSLRVTATPGNFRRESSLMGMFLLLIALHRRISHLWKFYPNILTNKPGDPL